MLESLDLSQTLDSESYRRELSRHQAALRLLAYQLHVQQRSAVILVEAWDGGGKGAAVKTITERLDPRGYAVHPSARTLDENERFHYLSRFWKRVPEDGHIAVFDGSWYQRVLLDRVEGRCTVAEWTRAFREINQFERELSDHGTILLKFWIHISEDEQLARFHRRLQNPRKSWKVSEADWRHRSLRSSIEEAVEAMLLRTNAGNAPWTLVEGNCKRWGRFKVVRTVVERLSDELNYNAFKALKARNSGAG